MKKNFNVEAKVEALQKNKKNFKIDGHEFINW